MMSREDGSEPCRAGQFLSLLAWAGRVVSNQFSRMARNRTGRGEEGTVFGVLGSMGLKIQETSGDVAMVGAGTGVSFCATERIGFS